MAAKFCVKGDFQVAVKAPRSSDHCRDHYRGEVLAAVELLRCEVTGVAPVTDARTQASIPPGQVVELDPEETNVAALVAAGAVKVAPAPKAEPKAKG